MKTTSLNKNSSKLAENLLIQICYSDHTIIIENLPRIQISLQAEQLLALSFSWPQDHLPQQGHPLNHKPVHLPFEAGLNLWKRLWGRLLIDATESHNLYPDSKYGSRPGQNSVDAVMAKITQYKNTVAPPSSTWQFSTTPARSTTIALPAT
jgi:hypothetical protein